MSSRFDDPHFVREQLLHLGQSGNAEAFALTNHLMQIAEIDPRAPLPYLAPHHDTSQARVLVLLDDPHSIGSAVRELPLLSLEASTAEAKLLRELLTWAALYDVAMPWFASVTGQKPHWMEQELGDWALAHVLAIATGVRIIVALGPEASARAARAVELRAKQVALPPLIWLSLPSLPELMKPDALKKADQSLRLVAALLAQDDWELSRVPQHISLPMLRSAVAAHLKHHVRNGLDSGLGAEEHHLFPFAAASGSYPSTRNGLLVRVMRQRAATPGERIEVIIPLGLEDHDLDADLEAARAVLNVDVSLAPVPIHLFFALHARETGTKAIAGTA